MIETSAHLDECPFCHHTGIRIEKRHIGRNCKVGHNVAYAVCQKCWCKGPMSRDDEPDYIEKAVSLWNAAKR